MCSRNTIIYAQEETNVGILNNVQGAEGRDAANC